MEKIVNFIRKKPVIFVILILIILLGLSLRAYHVDYELVSYHNWKSEHYLGEARDFARNGFFSEGFFIPSNDYPPLNGNPSGAHADTFPTISILVAIAFKIFGMDLAVARSVGILFGLGSIIGMFLLTRQLFKRDDIALTAAALTAILPLFVFFSHNIQLINPALFFMLVGAYYYLKWVENSDKKTLIYASTLLVLAALTKFTFLIIMLPLLIVTPLSTLKNSIKNIKDYIVPLLIFSALPIWMLYSSAVAGVGAGGRGFSLSSLINLSALYTVSWWTAIRSYAIDNYTTLGLLFAFLGIWAAAAFYKKNQSLAEKFIIYYGGTTILFFLLASEKLGGHSYHQFPIAPFFIIAIAYSFMVISSTLSKMLSTSVKENQQDYVKYFKIAFVLILLIIFYKGGAETAIDRQFDVQFLGLDIAGEHIKANSNPDERIVFSGGQSFGVLWHADRKGYYGINSVEDFQKAESLGATWAFVYMWGLNEIGGPKWDYIANNYHLEQAAFQNAGNDQQQLFYLLLKKGGSFDINKLNVVSQNTPVVSKDYEFTSGPQKLYYLTPTQ